LRRTTGRPLAAPSSRSIPGTARSGLSPRTPPTFRRSSSGAPSRMSWPL
jgi:hypothetical protein